MYCTQRSRPRSEAHSWNPPAICALTSTSGSPTSAVNAPCRCVEYLPTPAAQYHTCDTHDFSKRLLGYMQHIIKCSHVHRLNNIRWNYPQVGLPGDRSGHAARANLLGVAPRRTVGRAAAQHARHWASFTADRLLNAASSITMSLSLSMSAAT